MCTHIGGGDQADGAMGIRPPELAALLVESVHQLRRLLEDMVVLLNKRVPYLNHRPPNQIQQRQDIEARPNKDESATT